MPTKATAGDKHEACWASISRTVNGKIECLVNGEWRHGCSGCVWELTKEERTTIELEVMTL